MAIADPGLRRASWRALGLFLAALWMLLFLPAWSLAYWQAWIYWLLVGASCAAMTADLLERDADLVRRRIAVGATAETEPVQKRIMALMSVLFIVLLAGPAFAYGQSGATAPAWAVLLADALVVLGFLIIYLTFRANAFAAATIGTFSDQRVANGGPYRLVRHPMYAGALLMSGATPLALGSPWLTILVVPAAGLLAWRLIDEERYLLRHLPGYDDYCRATRFRLVPGIW